MTSKLFSEYLSRSSVHGLSYFGDNTRHWIERTFWVVTFVISMVACFFMVLKTWSKWQQSPLIVTQDDRFTPITDIPFPAVTVCPAEKIQSNTNLTRTFDSLQKFYREVQSRDMKLSDADKVALNITDEDIRMLIASSIICFKSFIAYVFHDDTLKSDLKHSEVESFLKAYRPPWNETFDQYSFRGKFGAKRLPWVFTEDGFCYTFNSQGNFQVFKQDT